MIAYHVVTERPMTVGQQLIFDQNHHSGVYQRVQEKLETVRLIYDKPAQWYGKDLEHHTSVALRELAMEEIRRQKYPHFPSRLNCLYVSQTMEEAEQWAHYFSRLGRPVYHIVKLRIDGKCFTGDASKCFRGVPDKRENLRLAELYWENKPSSSFIPEILVDGHITVLQIMKEIHCNIPERTKATEAF